jgi:hypothetical protein
MDDLLGRLDTLEHHVRTLEQQSSSALCRLRWWRRLACTLVLLTVFSLPMTLGAAQDGLRGGRPKDDQKETLRGLLQRFLAVERKLEHVTSETGADGFPEVVITGANLRVVNGLGITEAPNGTGNLIVGYNELRHSSIVELVGPDNRTGSHNVVVGSGQNFASAGGLVVGRHNTITGLYSVSAGTFNTAQGDFSAVTGGQFNLASARHSAVSGGELNEASGFGASVSGGHSNLADGSYTAVSGGVSNVASGTVASVSGGNGNAARAVASSISGGQGRTTSGEFDWVAGGLFQNQ